ncbi:diacylglycerol kinase family protein [Patescibacteria group bacterium]|nr:diacylglycerol kinase family protein [Patescibacteria group bacterium]
MLKQHTISIKHAWDGLVWALKTQPNYRVHLTLSLIAVACSVILKITYIEFLLVVFMITVGLVIETINTGLEQTTDAIDRKIREDIKIAKDVAAAAMLIYAFGSFLMACLIFGPRIISLLVK